MNPKLNAILLSGLTALSLTVSAQTADSGTSDAIRIYDETIFYDGYRGEVVDKDLNDGILRHRNSLYARKLTDGEMDRISADMTMNVTIGALCDNYDRIGNINLALVPKGAATYSPDEVQRIELGRFITPFMNKNKQPDSVPYEFDGRWIAHIFHDLNLREQYDLWVEFEVFGIPYAANSEVDGCAGRCDVFTGTLDFTSYGEPMANSHTGVLIPIAMKMPEYDGRYNLNNYKETATDTLGKTTRTWQFTVPADVSDAKIMLITSNHGANSGGEEYNRRLHLVYIDKELVMSYVPGGLSCEPFRVYNTQNNGIYGLFKRSDKFWASYSNWCPGDRIPVRVLELGAVKAGRHEIMIRVPDAVFADSQGDIPVSMYFQGVTEGTLPSGIDEAAADGPAAPALEIDGDIVRIVTDAEIDRVQIHTYDGRLLRSAAPRSDKSISLAGLSTGTYLVTFFACDGSVSTAKVAKR